MYLTNAIRNAQFSVTRITAAQFTVAHIYPCRLYRPHQKMVAEFTVAKFSGCPVFRCPLYIAQFTVYRGALTYTTTRSLDRQFWRSQISTIVKLKLYCACVLLIFLYSSECWAVTMNGHQIDARNQWCL